MPSRQETMSFMAQDGSGNHFTIIAERVAALIGGTTRKSPWTFRTDDWRHVRRAGPPGCYTIDPGDTRLTTDDPNEPKD